MERNLKIYFVSVLIYIWLIVFKKYAQSLIFNQVLSNWLIQKYFI